MLCEVSEQNWLDLIETDDESGLILTQSFYEYKSEVQSLKGVLNLYLKNCMTSILQGIPEIQDDEEESFDIQYLQKSF